MVTKPRFHPGGPSGHPPEYQNHPRESSRTGRPRARRPIVREPRRCCRGRLSAHRTQVDRPVIRLKAPTAWPTAVRGPAGSPKPHPPTSSPALRYCATSGSRGSRSRGQWESRPPPSAESCTGRGFTGSMPSNRPLRSGVTSGSISVSCLHLDVKKLARSQQPGHRVTGNRRQCTPGAAGATCTPASASPRSIPTRPATVSPPSSRPPSPTSASLASTSRV